MSLKNFPARVVQHETDHLDGVLFLERMASLDSLSFLDEFQRTAPARATNSRSMTSRPAPPRSRCERAVGAATAPSRPPAPVTPPCHHRRRDHRSAARHDRQADVRRRAPHRLSSATFEFGLEQVSRQFVWTALHSYPFYNSEQQSQRYVKLGEPKAYVPPIDGEARRFERRRRRGRATRGCRRSSRTTPAIFKRLRNITPKASPDRLKALEKEAEKKAIETARYVIPLAAFTAMVHTISGITLYRLMRMAQASDTPHEAREVIGAMVDAVRRHDPAFVERVDVVGLDAEDVVERGFPAARAGADAFAERFDRSLDGKVAQLVDWSPNAEEVVADARWCSAPTATICRPTTRSIACSTRPDPASARHDPGGVSLAADAVAAARQLHVPQALEPHRRLAGSAAPHGARLAAADDALGHRTSRLRDAPPDPRQPGRPGRIRGRDGARVDGQEPAARPGRADRVRALRPAERQGGPLRRVGPLIALLHKWTMRTCFNAQEEIYEASMEEVAQVRAVHPRLARFIGPPCVVRNGLVSPRCTEGSKFCGVPVWRDFPNAVRLPAVAPIPCAGRARHALRVSFAYGGTEIRLWANLADSVGFRVIYWRNRVLGLVCVFCHRRFRSRMSAITCWQV